MIKPLSTVLSSAVNKSKQHQDKNSWEHRESNPGPLGEYQKCNFCARQPPCVSIFASVQSFPAVKEWRSSEVAFVLSIQSFQVRIRLLVKKLSTKMDLFKRTAFFKLGWFTFLNSCLIYELWILEPL